jgi:uncharacterized protein
MSKRKFLEAEWNNLLMLNYEVDPAILEPYLPAYTELDLWQGKALVSMVGFMFNNTRVLGIKWPFHVSFEEVNLRFYVRYYDGKSWKRGAVFISEIVPKAAIVFFANNLYNEHYRALPMRHTVKPSVVSNYTDYSYEWKLDGKWNKLCAAISNISTPMQPGSPEEFIFEHYWGYNRINDKQTIEYAVEHMTWRINQVINPTFEADIASLYGKQFVPYLSVAPYSAFFAQGSEVVVRVGGKIMQRQALPVSL